MGWYFLSRVAASLVGVVTLLVLTRLLPPEDFGRFNLVVLSALIAQQLVFAWIVASITRFHRTPEFGGRTVALGFGTTALLGLLLAPALALAYPAVPVEWREAYVLTAIFAIGAGLHEIGLAALRVEGRGPAFALATLSRPAVGTALAAGFILAGGGYRSAVVALFLGALVGAAFAMAIVVRRSGLARPGWATVRIFFRFGQPLAVVRASSMAFALATQVLLARMVGLEQVGFFAAATMLTQRSITMLMITLGQTSAASVFGAHEDAGKTKVVETLEEHFSFLLLVSAPLVVLFMFAGETVARMLFGATVGAGVAQYLPLLALAALVSGLQGAFFAFAFSINQQTLLQLGLSLGLLALHVPLTMLLIGGFGGIGAAYATVATSVLGASAYAWYGRDLFGSCVFRGALVKMGTAAAGAIPFLFAAAAQPTTFRALLLVGAGMLAMLSLLKLLRYSSLEAVIGALRQRIPAK